MRPKAPPTLLGVLAAAALAAGCSGGDVSPEDAGEGGIPPRVETPRTNIGQSEGFPGGDAAGEAQD